jgi:hypothetical protein
MSMHERSTTRTTANEPSTATGASAPALFNQNYEFVRGTGQEARRQVRRHAMRQFSRQKKLASAASLRLSYRPPSAAPPMSTPLPALGPCIFGPFGDLQYLPRYWLHMPPYENRHGLAEKATENNGSLRNCKTGGRPGKKPSMMCTHRTKYTIFNNTIDEGGPYSFILQNPSQLDLMSIPRK